MYTCAETPQLFVSLSLRAQSQALTPDKRSIAFSGESAPAKKTGEQDSQGVPKLGNSAGWPFSKAQITPSTCTFSINVTVDLWLSENNLRSSDS